MTTFKPNNSQSNQAIAQGKVVVITGCSSGIGYEAAKILQQRGYRVFPGCRKPEDVERLKAEGFADAFQIDLASSDSIARAVEFIIAKTNGQVFALFNNAAYGLPGAVEDLSRDALRRQFEVNVLGTHELTRALLPYFLKQQDARIIQNSSILGFVTMTNRGAYNASKFALEGLSDTLRMELRDSSVKVCIIQPGPIVSNFRKNALSMFEREIDIDASRHALMYRQALERLRKDGPAMRFTLPASAVVDKLIHALESQKPKLRYRVTVPTHITAFLKRLLSHRLLERFLLKFGSP